MNTHPERRNYHRRHDLAYYVWHSGALAGAIRTTVATCGACGLVLAFIWRSWAGPAIQRQIEGVMVPHCVAQAAEERRVSMALSDLKTTVEGLKSSRSTRGRT